PRSSPLSLHDALPIFLFLRSGLSLQPVLFGGAHENQRRPGTENVPDIAGMAAAAEFVVSNRQAEQDRQLKLRDELWNVISRNVRSEEHTSELQSPDHL